MFDFIHSILNPLYTPLFTVGGVETTIAEVLGFITGALCVYLVVRQNILTFPVGIANAFFFCLIFADVKLFADMGLQIVYIFLGFFGWYAWLKFGPDHGAIKTPKRASRKGILIGLASTTIITAILYPILIETGGSAPFWDSLTTALSLTAQGMLSFKILENWLWWIVADIIYIPLYISKDLYLTAAVYVIFMGLCFAGLYQWKQSYDASKQDPDGKDDMVAVPA